MVWKSLIWKTFSNSKNSSDLIIFLCFFFFSKNNFPLIKTKFILDIVLFRWDLAKCFRGIICQNQSGFRSFPGSSEVRVSACSAGELGLIPGLGRSPGWRKWQPTPVFLPGKSHGQRSLVGYTPQGSKELDMTEQLHFLYSNEKLNIISGKYSSLPW